MTIGFAGLGDMGFAMAKRMLDEGVPLALWNRTPSKTDELLRQGAKAVDTPEELLEQCDLVGICLTSHHAIEQVTFGPRGLLSRAPHSSRKTVVDFSTGCADAAVVMARKAAAIDVGWVDAPVSGGVNGAEQGSLIVFAGGVATDVKAAMPLLHAVASRVEHTGPSGTGQTTKLLNQMIVGCNLLVMAEVISLARKAGIKAGQLPGSMAAGFADSLPLQIFGPRMASHSFLPRLASVGLLMKDLDLAVQLADRCDSKAPVAALCHSLLSNFEQESSLSLVCDLSAIIGLYEQVVFGAPVDQEPLSEREPGG